MVAEDCIGNSDYVIKTKRNGMSAGDGNGWTEALKIANMKITHAYELLAPHIFQELLFDSLLPGIALVLLKLPVRMTSLLLMETSNNG